MKLLGSRILIQPSEPIRQLPSGIYLPERAVEKQNTGIVVLLGSNADIRLLNAKVLYNPVIAIEIEGKHLVHQTDIKLILSWQVT